MRPCFCDRYIPGQPWVMGRDCRLCWLYHHIPERKAQFDDDTIFPPTAPPTEEEKEKSLSNRLAAFANAMKIELAWRAKGGSPPTPEEKAARRAICDGNKCGLHDTNNDSCKGCGCYLEAGLLPPRPLGKLDCSTQRCPKGLWGFLGGYEGKGKCGGA